MLFAHFTTSEGKFTIQLFDQEAPKTVENFVGLAEGTRSGPIRGPGERAPDRTTTAPSSTG
jgi:peptidyl-prolyl cis-trans isomerase A (cyclophilin A)